MHIELLLWQYIVSEACAAACLDLTLEIILSQEDKTNFAV